MVSGAAPLLHMALEAATTGYVGLGFSTASGGMLPSDVVWGAVSGPGQATVSQREGKG